jgi:hypothetical protein
MILIDGPVLESLEDSSLEDGCMEENVPDLIPLDLKYSNDHGSSAGVFWKFNWLTVDDLGKDLKYSDDCCCFDDI